MKTMYDSLIRATVKVTNTNDDVKRYAILADVQIEGGEMHSISNGSVKREDTIVANFDRWSADRLNVNIYGIDVNEQCDVLAEINAFVDSVEALAQAQTINF